MNTRLQQLGREAYIASTSSITDPESRRFADQALAWWDRHFSWNAQGCDVLVDEDDAHLCYIFSKIDRYGEYLTVYNLFTPLYERRKGHAHELLGLIIARSLEHHVRRITFASVSASLDFYLDLGFVFWGINDIGDYYCDLPIPPNGLEEMAHMTLSSDLETLIGKKMAKIRAKVDGNEKNLSPSQSIRYTKDRIKLGRTADFSHC